MRLIDADKLLENSFKNPISYNAFCNLVKRQMTVDAVPLIRCKDCKWFNDLGCAIRIVDESDKPKETDFCSFGERKDGDS